MAGEEKKRKKTLLYEKAAMVVFGIFLALLILEIGLRVSGFLLLSLQEHRNRESIREKGEYRVLCLGESTTQGQYPYILEEILNKRGPGIKFSVIDKGLAASNTAAIISGLEVNLDKYRPDLVVAMMGINDDKSPYGITSGSKTGSLLKPCRVYKLLSLLKLHITDKLSKIRGPGTTPHNRAAKGPAGDNNESGLKEMPIKSGSRFDFNDSSTYVGLGRFCMDEGRFIEAEEALKKAIASNPRDGIALLLLGRLYRMLQRPGAEELFVKAAEFTRNDATFARYAYMELSFLYSEQKKFPEAEEVLNKAIAIDPKESRVYTELGWVYLNGERFAEALEIFERALEAGCRDERIYGGLAIVYHEMGNNKLSKQCANKAQALRERVYNPMTAENYHKLKLALDERKIQLVCVQYPMRDIMPLRRIFEEEEDIIFVDNEARFKDTVRKADYKEYFADMFAGDFGHCTEKGNRLLAENIARAILKNIFGE